MIQGGVSLGYLKKKKIPCDRYKNRGTRPLLTLPSFDGAKNSRQRQSDPRGCSAGCLRGERGCGCRRPADHGRRRGATRTVATLRPSHPQPRAPSLARSRFVSKKVGTSVLPLTFRVSPAQEYEDDFDDEEEEEEDDYGDDDFEEDDSEPSPAPKPSVSSASARSANALESDIARATRLENERARRPSRPRGSSPRATARAGPCLSAGSRAYPREAARGGALTDAQGAPRAPDQALASGPPRRFYDARGRGVRRRVAAGGGAHDPRADARGRHRAVRRARGRHRADRRGRRDARVRDANRLPARRRRRTPRRRRAVPRRPLGAREDLEARCALEALEASGGGGAAAVRREAAAQKAAKWARATGDPQHSREKRLAGFVARARAPTRRRCFASGGFLFSSLLRRRRARRARAAGRGARSVTRT